MGGEGTSSRPQSHTRCTGAAAAERWGAARAARAETREGVDLAGCKAVVGAVGAAQVAA